MAEYWLVTYEGTGHVLTDEEFYEFADRVKYDGVEYQAEPLRSAGQPGASHDR